MSGSAPTGPDAAGPSHRPAADQGDCETGLDPLHVLAALKRLKGQTKGWLSTAVGLAEQAICQAYLASLQGPGAGSKGDDDGAKKQKKKRLAEGHARNDKHQDSEDQSADTREETARREKKAAKKAKKAADAAAAASQPAAPATTTNSSGDTGAAGTSAAKKRIVFSEHMESLLLKAINKGMKEGHCSVDYEALLKKPAFKGCTELQLRKKVSRMKSNIAKST